MTKYIIYLLLIFMASCQSSAKKQDNGLHYVDSKFKSLSEEYYVYANEYNGVYVQYSDSPAILSMGTYMNGKKNGLWDTLVSEDAESQIFYSNDSALRIYKHKYYFNYYQLKEVDFTLFSPIGWLLIDSLQSNGELTGISSTFEGSIKPQFSIYKIETSNKSIGDIVTAYYDNTVAVDSSFIQFNRLSSRKYSFTHLESDSLSYDVKIIRTQTGIYCLNCMCEHSVYHYYHDIFETMLNSFNPISDTKQ